MPAVYSAIRGGPQSQPTTIVQYTAAGSHRDDDGGDASLAPGGCAFPRSRANLPPEAVLELMGQLRTIDWSARRTW